MLPLCVKTYMNTFIVYSSVMEFLVFLSGSKGKDSQFFIFLEFELILFLFQTHIGSWGMRMSRSSGDVAVEVMP